MIFGAWVHCVSAPSSIWNLLQAAEEAQSGSGSELQQVEEQLEALDAELAKQGGTQAPASKHNHIHVTAVIPSHMASSFGLY